MVVIDGWRAGARAQAAVGEPRDGLGRKPAAGGQRAAAAVLEAGCGGADARRHVPERSDAQEPQNHEQRTTFDRIYGVDAACARMHLDSEDCLRSGHVSVSFCAGHHHDVTDDMDDELDDELSECDAHEDGTLDSLDDDMDFDDDL